MAQPGDTKPKGRTGPGHKNGDRAKHIHVQQEGRSQQGLYRWLCNRNRLGTGFTGLPDISGRGYHGERGLGYDGRRGSLAFSWFPEL